MVYDAPLNRILPETHSTKQGNIYVKIVKLKICYLYRFILVGLVSKFLLR